jgi:hypothetical protein
MIKLLLQPPKELLIEIRVLIPCGEIMTDKGPVNLSQVGDTQFLRRFHAHSICIFRFLYTISNLKISIINTLPSLFFPSTY